ncbi:NETI motif-containing protein [Rossellomorea marisflavi]|uniref:NETI motif-containing protein n=1 Tax=Rossellomorea marisflavi TaxID=189381 RepID=UPI0009A75F31|nr:NETI motif-containing protein [Rossellomorea marisflavi]MDW4524944.1 NETI motif-containing protein [Rossellomorea marisflavi]MDW4528939.1 NETI motif-containing protein [Rossellomorea marisflavi]WJV18594.1 NETI motif-containing protein [Rossellomorea marisflavi]
MSKKMLFEVKDGETIGDCLDRMKDQGYMPVRRMEKPVFEEQGKETYVPVKQTIVFEGKKIEE